MQTPDGEPGCDRQPLLHRVDSAVGLLLLAVCGYLYYLTTTFDEVAGLLAQNITPDFFPVLVLIVLAALTLGLPFEHILHRRRGDDIDSARREPVAPVAYQTAGLLVFLVLATPYIGTVAAICSVCLTLPLLWGERRLKLILPFAVLFPAAVFLLFAWILQVQFEPGIFVPFAN